MLFLNTGDRQIVPKRKKFDRKEGKDILRRTKLKTKQIVKVTIRRRKIENYRRHQQNKNWKNTSLRSVFVVYQINMKK